MKRAVNITTGARMLSSRSTHRVVVVPKTGTSDVLQVEEHPIPVLDDGEEPQVLVENTYAGVNFIDTYFRSGLYQVPEMPFVAGQEGVGVIIDMNDAAAAEGAELGQRVAHMQPGSYSEVQRVPYQGCVELPFRTAMEDACALMVQGLTAHYLVTDAHAGSQQGRLGRRTCRERWHRKPGLTDCEAERV